MSVAMTTHLVALATGTAALTMHVTHVAAITQLRGRWQHQV